MKPTVGPDPAMPEEYGMYNGDYEGYDEDEFFYHMYFDEVSTTPVPEEFYDILEYVSNSDGNSFSNYPDYFDYIRGGPGLGRNNSESDLTTQPSLRQNKNKRYLQFGDLNNNNNNNSRRNSKFLQFKRRKEAASEAKAISKRSASLPKTSKKLSSEAAHVRTKRASKKKNKKNKKKKAKVGFRKRKQLEPGVIGILDRRIPIFFRQSPFVSIALTQFVILSTGVTTGKRGHFNLRPET